MVPGVDGFQLVNYENQGFMTGGAGSLAAVKGPLVLGLKQQVDVQHNKWLV